MMLHTRKKILVFIDMTAPHSRCTFVSYTSPHSTISYPKGALLDWNLVRVLYSGLFMPMPAAHKIVWTLWQAEFPAGHSYQKSGTLWSLRDEHGERQHVGLVLSSSNDPEMLQYSRFSRKTIPTLLHPEWRNGPMLFVLDSDSTI